MELVVDAICCWLAEVEVVPEAVDFVVEIVGVIEVVLVPFCGKWSKPTMKTLPITTANTTPAMILLAYSDIFASARAPASIPLEGVSDTLLFASSVLDLVLNRIKKRFDPLFFVPRTSDLNG